MHIFSTGNPQAIQELSERVQKLENEILTLKTTIKLAKSEWDDLYDKISKQVERMRKRATPALEDRQEATQNTSGLSELYPRHALLAEARKRGQ